MMTRVNQFVEQEEDEARANENFNCKPEGRASDRDTKSFRRNEPDRNRASTSSAVALASSLGRGQNHKSKQVYAAPSYKAIKTIFKEPIYKLFNKIKTQPFFK